MKRTILTMTMLTGILSLGAFHDRDPDRIVEITFTNNTHGIILTPPIFALSSNRMSIFEIGQPASLGLEMVAEGGSTDELRAELEEGNVLDVIQTMAPVMPGQSITVELAGTKSSRLNVASMLLPTNDGFVAVNGERVGKRKVIHLYAHDAGTEMNDEVCSSIPGPQCGSEGYNAAGGEGFVVRHAGIHGEGELSRRSYNWGGPVATVTIRVKR